MCRHLAYVGPTTGAGGLVLDPPHGLVAQVDAPRCQQPGITNRDGWGMAWIEDGAWRQHRSVRPLSDDADAPAELAQVRSEAVMVAVRRASPGLELVETGNAPFVEGRWAFSLNGFVGGFAGGPARGHLLEALGEGRARGLTGDTDSEVLFGLVLDRLDAGAAPAEALRDVVRLCLAAAGSAPSRLNLLLSDGVGLWATRWSNSLFHRRVATGAVVVASEPWDDAIDWVEVPDRSVVAASPHGVTVELLGAPLA